MYARSTTFQAQPSSIDAGITYMRDAVMPALEELGSAGMSLLVDRNSGRCIATSSWESEAVMHLTGHAARPLGERAAAMFDGARLAVDEWEIAVLHRDHRSHDGACVRATWFQFEPDQVDGATDFYRTSVMSSLAELEGFCSASLLIGKTSGRAVSSVTFDSVAAMVRNREQASALRDAKVAELGAQLVDIREFELAIAHLRVPELA